MNFEICFPLILNFNKQSGIRFDLLQQSDSSILTIGKGFYYIQGENGSGKSSFLSMLALLSGSIGKKASKQQGYIKYNNTLYNKKNFNCIKAAKIREKDFCIFTQEVFFLPGISSRRMYSILNSSDKSISIPRSEKPNFLSGGQQQSRYMDILFKHDKPVWFLDEPFNNLDNNNKIKFWNLIKNIKHDNNIYFLIDHSLTDYINKENSQLFANISTTAYSSNKNDEYNISFYKIIDVHSFIDNDIHKGLHVSNS